MGLSLPMARQGAKWTYDPEIDGVTNGLLQTWGACREKARLHLKGLTKRSNSFALTYGDLTHWLLQHVYEDHRMNKLPVIHGELEPGYVKTRIAQLEKIWLRENPMASAELVQNMELTMMMNETLMPFYFQHWRRDFLDVKWIGLESEFKIPFEVERHGITYKTFLRGKRDGVFTENGTDRWLFETKTKSRIDEGTLEDILPFESQINLYLVAIWKESGALPKGVRYNIVRRPSLRQKKTENLRQFANRMTADVKGRPAHYFMRHKMKIDPRELDRYLGELEDRVWEFMHWSKGLSGHWKESGHCENKYGVCQFLSFCSRNDLAPFFFRDRMFGELAAEVE